MALCIQILFGLFVVAGVIGIWKLLTLSDRMMRAHNSDAEYFRRKFQGDEETRL